MELFNNAVLISVLIMSILCLLRCNVLLAIICASLIAGIISEYHHDNISFLQAATKSVNILITGMKGNLETALSYILLGALAVAISRTDLTAFLINTIARFISDRRVILLLIIATVACFSQNLIPVHIAFIPILIPPLLSLFNHLKIDRRAVACALTFGLKAPYITFSIGFGYIFHTTIKDQIIANGQDITLSDVSHVMWIGGLIMLIGLIGSMIFYSKDRFYEEKNIIQADQILMGYKEWVTLFALLITFIVQLLTNSLPLGAFLGLMVMIITRAIKWSEMDAIMEGGLKMMAFIAFVMLVAAGYAEILRNSGEVRALVDAIQAFTGGKVSGAMLMLFVGLLITIGIGTSFGTIPIIAAIYVPLGLSLGFSISAIILLIGIAGALGDAGSPASDSTLGPTSGLNADGQHDHIKDTCIPTFLAYNVPLLIGGTIAALLI